DLAFELVQVGDALGDVGKGGGADLLSFEESSDRPPCSDGPGDLEDLGGIQGAADRRPPDVSADVPGPAHPGVGTHFENAAALLGRVLAAGYLGQVSRGLELGDERLAGREGTALPEQLQDLVELQRLEVASQDRHGRV